jgi:60 kDa SS-A/Ro ribonucleoprotein
MRWASDALRTRSCVVDSALQKQKGNWWTNTRGCQHKREIFNIHTDFRTQDTHSHFTREPRIMSTPSTTVPNSCGSAVFQLTDINRLRRFLILGSEGGTYYISAHALGLQNANCIGRLISSGQGLDVVSEIVTISQQDRAPKQEPLIFALAMCARSSDPATQAEAYRSLTQVCRTPAHLFAFIEYCQQLSRPQSRGCGRAHRRAIAEFYNSRTAMQLAYLCTKYPSRNGWTHRDVLRLNHIHPRSHGHDVVFSYVIGGIERARIQHTKLTTSPANTASEADITKTTMQIAGMQLTIEQRSSAEESGQAHKGSTNESTDSILAYLEAVSNCHSATNDDIAVDLIRRHNFTREHIPTALLNSVRVWVALLEQMPVTAMLRNLGKMASLGMFQPGSVHTDLVCEVLKSAEKLKRAHIHPFTVLVALATFREGHGDRGSLSWPVNPAIITALNTAFQLAFGTVEPTGKRMLLALDVSGSMAIANLSNSRAVSARLACAAMALVTALVETEVTTMAFSQGFIPFDMPRSATLESVIQAMSLLPFTSTDCALPMKWALEQKLPIDTFVVYTDNETNFGTVTPVQALRTYREQMGIDARLIVVGMTATEFTIADPTDSGMLDVVGFDTNSPSVISNFSAGLL